MVNYMYVIVRAHFVVTTRSAYGMYMYTAVCVCVRVFVGSCLATKSFYSQFAGYHKVGGVHSTMHLVHPNRCHCM